MWRVATLRRRVATPRRLATLRRVATHDIHYVVWRLYVKARRIYFTFAVHICVIPVATLEHNVAVRLRREVSAQGGRRKATLRVATLRCTQGLL